ncbi:glycosyltransferase [Ekhidna sp.]|uniref:glycosyltransferase family 2 protein n=1 Tax=Ekhidna sp. TaxID=2608089 RepID=UPI003298E3B0
MANPQPLVSVILPFHNAPFLKESVQSILNQSYSNFELILIDNASTDNSSAVAKSFEHISNVQLLREPKKGVVFASNTGMQSAKGSLIARMDADDIANPNRLKWQLEAFEIEPSLGLVSGLVEYMGPKENEGFRHYVNWLNDIQTEDEIRINQFVEFPIANPTIMIRKEVVEQFGMYEEGEFPEDYEFFLRLQSHGVKMKKVNKVILKWRDLETRLTRMDNRYAQDSFFRIKAKYLAQWLEKNNSFHPKVYLWGAGRLSRRRSEYVIEEGVQAVKFIDVKAGNHTIHYSDVPEKDEAFIVSYVGNRGARDEIRDFLNGRGYKEGINYIIAS